MKRVFVFVLCIVYLLFNTSCAELQHNYERHVQVKRMLKFFERDNEIWVSDDNRIQLFLGEGNHMQVSINCGNCTIECYGRMFSYSLTMYFSSVDPPDVFKPNSSDDELMGHFDDYKLIEFDNCTLLTADLDEFTATVKIDRLNDFGYEKLYNEGDVVTFRYYPKAQN